MVSIPWQSDVSLIPYEADFHSTIRAVVPQIVSYLSDNSRDVFKVAVDTIKALLVDGKHFKMECHKSNVFKAEFRSDIKTAIPQIVSRLTDARSDVRSIAADLIRTSLMHGKSSR